MDMGQQRAVNGQTKCYTSIELKPSAIHFGVGHFDPYLWSGEVASGQASSLEDEMAVEWSSTKTIKPHPLSFLVSSL